MKISAAAVLAMTLLACGGGEDELPAPIAEVPGQLGRMAVNDASIFAIDVAGGIVEVNLADGAVVGPLPTLAPPLDVVAAADWVAWTEPEGTGFVVRRRKGDGVVESKRAISNFEPHIVGRADGLFFSDLQLVAKWEDDGVVNRVATPGLNPRLLDVDANHAYTIEGDTSVQRYMLGTDVGEVLLPTSMGSVSVKAEQLAYRTGEGIRLRNVTTTFDRIVGNPPAGTMCDLVIAGVAVMCGKYRSLDGMTDELLRDPVNGSVAVGKDLYWVTLNGGVSEIRKVDAEFVPKKGE